MPKPRELSKCREWEKERRDRLKNSFTALNKVLPCYDPSTPLSRGDILTKATEYIEELQNKVKALLSSDTINKPEREEIKKLYERIKKLVNRNEQLCNLLKDSGISVPQEYGKIGSFKRSHRWSNKFTSEQAKKLSKNENENKENALEKRKRRIKQKAALNKGVMVKQRKNVGKKKQKNGESNSQTLCNTGSCFIITNGTNGLSKTGKTPTVLTNSALLTTPLVASTIKPPTTTTSLTTLGPGTLIFANGNIVPVLPPNPTIIPANPTIIANPAPILVNPTPNKTTVFVVASTSSNAPASKESQLTMQFPRIRPKVCSTKTTQVNKVPIPALSSNYGKSLVLVGKSCEVVKSKENQKKICRKEASVKGGKVAKSEVKEKAVDVTKETVKRKQDCNEETEVKKQKIEETSKSDEKKTTGKEQSFTIDSICKENAPQEQEKNIEQPKSPEKITATDKPDIDKQSTEIIKVSEVVAEPVVSAKPIETPTQKPETTEVTTTPTQPEQNKPKTLDLNLPHSELSNDIFASLQVPTGGQNPESTSPTAAFLLAFPLVSTVKVTEVIEEENSDSQPTILQIGTMDSTKVVQTTSDSFTPSLLNLDTLAFFSGKESFYDNFVSSWSNVCSVGAATTVVASKCSEKVESEKKEERTGVKDIFGGVSKESNLIAVSKDNGFLHVAFSKDNNGFGCSENLFRGGFSDFETRTSKNEQFLPQEALLNFKTKPQDVLTTTFSTDLPKFNNCVNYPNSFFDTTTQKQNTTITKNPTKYNFTTKPNYTIAQCNTFNPFTEITKPISTTNYNKTYPEPLYTNSNYTYNCNMEAPYTSTNNYTKNQNKSYYTYDSNNYDYKTQFPNNYYQNNQQTKRNKPQPKPPVNWMMTPDLKQQTDYILPPFTNSTPIYPTNSFNAQTTYFPTSTTEVAGTFPETKNTFVDENQFNCTWSPSKLQLLDAQHPFVPSTLPTLVGDLALGTTAHFVEKDGAKGKECRGKDGRRTKGQSYDSQNFLSVSQLVDRSEAVPARTSVRRNSGSRSKNGKSGGNKRVQTQKEGNQKSTEVKGVLKNQTQSYQDWTIGGKSSQLKGHSSSYTAEALIGHQNQSEATHNHKRNQQNYSNTTTKLPFLTDNIMPYFPPVELQQDNFTQQNQNYQTDNFSHSFTNTIQNTSYSTNNFLPTGQSYLPTSNFIPDLSHEYNISDNLFTNTTKYNKQTRTEERKNTSLNCTVNANNFHNKKPSKVAAAGTTAGTTGNRKQQNETNNPGFVDFSFLSMPSTINSPILPDDFHTNFLPPPTPHLYSCKNSLYPKQSAELNSGGLLPLPVPVSRNNVPPDISPSVNNVSTSLTNFNLCAIFPEINKRSAPVPDLFTEQIRTKEVPKNYVTSSQGSNCNKSTYTPTYSTIHTFTNS